jgi:hypothetical protein
LGDLVTESNSELDRIVGLLVLHATLNLEFLLGRLSLAVVKLGEPWGSG